MIMVATRRRRSRTIVMGATYHWQSLQASVLRYHEQSCVPQEIGCSCGCCCCPQHAAHDGRNVMQEPDDLPTCTSATTWAKSSSISPTPLWRHGLLGTCLITRRLLRHSTHQDVLPHDKVMHPRLDRGRQLLPSWLSRWQAGCQPGSTEGQTGAQQRGNGFRVPTLTRQHVARQLKALPPPARRLTWKKSFRRT